MTDDRTEQAIDLITSCCPKVGAFHGTSDVHCYLRKAASEMAASNPSEVFPGRYIEHVAYAVEMVASSEFTSSPAAVAAVYLVTRFEFYFRVLSEKLNADGKWNSLVAQNAAQGAIDDSRLGQKGISSVALAYKIMKLNKSRSIVQHCAAVDKALYSSPTSVVGAITDIGDRIEYGRNSVAHGHWGDISAEALFYGLMTSLVFYNTA